MNYEHQLNEKCPDCENESMVLHEYDDAADEFVCERCPCRVDKRYFIDPEATLHHSEL